MVVGDFSAIDELLCMDGNGVLYTKGFGRLCHQIRKRSSHVLGQEAAVSAGISDELLFVE